MSRQQKIKRKKEKTTRNGACARTTVIPDTLVRSERRNPTALPIPTQFPAAARYKYNSRQRPQRPDGVFAPPRGGSILAGPLPPRAAAVAVGAAVPAVAPRRAGAVDAAASRLVQDQF